ncbi:MAG: hypothetical protein FD123_1358 [Bacteroidetes bacterium]|nr:MAG: hypothetical protein FD123_1358 [Bacteroidota bacterium]
MTLRLLLLLFIPSVLHAQFMPQKEALRLHLKSIKMYQQHGKKSYLNQETRMDSAGRTWYMLYQFPYKKQIRRSVIAYTYDAGGRIAMELRVSHDTLRDSTVYFYPEDGFLLTSKSYRNGRLQSVQKTNQPCGTLQWEKQSEQGIVRSTQQTDSLRDPASCTSGIVRQETLDFYGRKIVTETTECTEDCKGIYKTVIRHGDENELQRMETIYDTVRRTREMIDYDHIGNMKWRTVSQLDSLGRTSSTTSYDAKSRISGRSVFSYRDDGKLLHSIQYDQRGRVTTETIFTYCENGLQQETQAVSRKKKEKFRTWWEYEYYHN